MARGVEPSRGWVAGADGCRGGWVVATRSGNTGAPWLRVVERLATALEGEDAPEVLCVDVPIGLFEAAVPGGRDCDRSARALLGSLRGRSVFSPPARAALGASTYDEASRANRRSSPHAIGMSRQSFGILPKIREADALVTPALQERVVECHPELSFYEMNGRAPVVPSKKRSAGRAERRRLLERSWGTELASHVETFRRGPRVPWDDVLDAMAACWTAERVLRSEAVRIPETPPVDARGLRMEIVR